MNFICILTLILSLTCVKSQSCEDKCATLYPCIPICITGNTCLKKCKNSNNGQNGTTELCQSKNPLEDLTNCLKICIPDPKLKIEWDLDKKIPKCRLDCTSDIKPCLQEMSSLGAQNTQVLNTCLETCKETYEEASKNRLCSENCLFDFLLN